MATHQPRRRSHSTGQAGGGSSVNAVAVAQRATGTWVPRAPSANGGNAFDAGMTYDNRTVTAGITTLAALQTWFDGIPNGASTTNHTRVLLGAGRTYAGATGIQIAGRSHITFEGGGTETSGSVTVNGVTASYGGQTGGAVINMTSSSAGTGSSAFRSAVLAATPANDIRFHGLGILGSHTAYATTTAGDLSDSGVHQMGWALYGATDILIDHCSVSRITSDFVYIAARTNPGVDWATDITVRYCTFAENGRMGIGLIAGSGVLVERCRFTNVCYAVWDMEPNVSGEGATDVEFSRNLIDGTYFSWDTSYDDFCFGIAGDDPVAALFTGYSKIIDNVITATMYPPSNPSQTSHFRFQHPTSATKSAVLTVTGNTTNQAKVGYTCMVGGWTGGGTISNNTGFKTTGTWYNDLGGNGSFTMSGNT